MFCDVKEEKTKVALTASEIREGFELAWATPEEIIKANKGIVDKPWLDRDTFFIQCLMDGTVES